MTVTSALVPLALSLVLATVVGSTHRWFPPALAARALLVTIVVVVVAAAPTVWLVAAGFVAHLPPVRGAVTWWGDPFGHHQPISAWLGVPALLVSVIGLFRVRAVLRAYRSLCTHHAGDVEVVVHDAPFAYTVPGRGGQVVLSSGLLALLDDAEQSVVIAHERAHARHRHDRFMLASELAVSVVPVLLPLSRRVLFALERWADESAVRVCGDRAFVARTLGKVALRRVAPAGALAVGGLGVPGRVAALLGPEPAAPRRSDRAALYGTIGVTMALAAYQLHHLGLLLIEICRH